MRVKMLQGVVLEHDDGSKERFKKGCVFNVADELGKSWQEAEPPLAWPDGEEPPKVVDKSAKVKRQEALAERNAARAARAEALAAESKKKPAEEAVVPEPAKPKKAAKKPAAKKKG